ncbi:MAG: transposase [Myxococcota bacterium]|jgi:transposase
MHRQGVKLARKSYTTEFRAEAVALVLEQGLSASRAARDLGLSQATLSRWVKASQLAAVPGALKNAEREELNQLRTEAKRLRMELDIF